MKHKIRDIDQKWRVYALAGCVVALFTFCLFNLGTIWGAIKGFFRIMSPVIIGLVVAYIMNPLAMLFYKRVFKNIKRKGIKWPLSVALTIITLLAIVALLCVLLIPQIVDNVLSLIDNYPSYLESLRIFAQNNAGLLGTIPAVESFIDSLTVESGLINKLGNLLFENSTAIIQSTASAGTVAFNWIIGIVFAIYFLLAKRILKRGFHRVLSLGLEPAKNARTLTILDKFNTILSKYIVFELLDSMIIGVANYLFMIICHMPNAILISVIMALTNLIPTFGPIIGVAISGFILLLIHPTSVIPLLIYTLVSQLLDSYIIKPNLFGNALDVPGFLILVAIVCFGKVMGIAGMLLAIPFAAIIVYLYEELFINWLKRRKANKEADSQLTDNAGEK